MLTPKATLIPYSAPSAGPSVDPQNLGSLLEEVGWPKAQTPGPSSGTPGHPRPRGPVARRTPRCDAPPAGRWASGRAPPWASPRRSEWSRIGPAGMATRRWMCQGSVFFFFLFSSMCVRMNVLLFAPFGFKGNLSLL